MWTWLVLLILIKNKRFYADKKQIETFRIYIHEHLIFLPCLPIKEIRTADVIHMYYFPPPPSPTRSLHEEKHLSYETGFSDDWLPYKTEGIERDGSQKN